MLRAHYRRYTIFVTGLPQPKRRAEDCQRLKPQLETLEPRLLMTASPSDALLSSSGICNCAICTGQGLPHMTGTIAAGDPIGEPAASNPLSSIPLLSSNAGATKKLVLDFNGHTEANWGGYVNVVTKVYDQDGDLSTFSDAELASIQEIWARVAEDYAPFNIDVTTIDPGGSANGVIARIAIGGNYSDWYGSSAGGVAYIGGFFNSASNVGYVFEDALGNGNARYVAEAASHEAGHLFGLQHQSLWNGSTLSQSYYQGNADWAPIMGVGYYSERTTWHNGTTTGPITYQDDMFILANASNGFGYRNDDYGSTQALASTLVATAGSVNMSGRISTNTDEDWFSFTTGGGALNLSLNVAQIGANLDSVLEVRDSTGTVVASASPTNSLSASLTATLTSGTYFVVAKSTGGYGNVGQYTLTGTVPGGGGGGVSAPEITVSVGATGVLTGGTVNFGSVQVGQYANQTITFTNTGNATLTLTQPTALQMPAGFSIITNFATTSLAAGASTTLVVRFTPSTAGNTSGTLTIASNDADEGSFAINLTGTATPAPEPEITVSVGTTGVLTGGSVNFGTVQVGQYVNQTITFKNTGNGTLTLTAPTALQMPAGFSIITNFASTTLAAGASTTLVVRFTPTAAGNISGTLTIASNDADEGSFAINLAGTATPGPQPEITVSVGTTGVLTGGSVNFGSVQVSKYANQTITFKNTGNATLTLVKPTALQMPAGFTIITNFASTTLLAGQSTTLVVRFTPTAVGNVSGTLTIASNDADEGAFVINLTGTATPGPTPEITVSVGTTGVLTGGTVNYGNVPVGQYLNQIITFKNTGTATLTLVKPTALQMPAGFTIITNFASTSLAAGQSTTLVVRFTATVVGNVSGTLTIASNDADESAFAINLTGAATPAPIIRAIDNGAAGFTTVGNWTRSVGVGRESDVHTALKGNGGTQATWTFTDLPAGQYRIHASWPGSPTYATNSPFTVFDGTTALGTVVVNQEQASSGFTWSGTNWSNLGVFSITGTSIRVQLGNLTNDRVVADAIRVERIGDLAPTVAAGSLLAPVATPTSSQNDSSAPLTNYAPVLASSFSFGASSDNHLSASNVDSLFAETGDTHSELLLLSGALDLVKSTHETTGSSDHTESDELSSDPIGENWLLGNELEAVLT